uniref:Tc3 transposase DNA binding domain-containing protein n=1 Tax=Pygocentrus nattereri TaxID=42514 RepID=A0AAR2LX54_PYGNA
MGKKGDLNDFERGMAVGARRAGLSISETAGLLGFSRTTISRVYRERSEKEKISSERQLCGRKCLVDVRGQRRMGRLVQDDRKATVTQITSEECFQLRVPRRIKAVLKAKGAPTLY